MKAKEAPDRIWMACVGDVLVPGLAGFGLSCKTEKIRSEDIPYIRLDLHDKQIRALIRKAEPKPQFDKEGWPTDITPTELTYYHRSGKSLPVAFRLACDKLARDAEIARLKAKLEKAEEIIMLAS